MSPVIITGQMQADKLHPLSNMHGVLYALACICESTGMKLKMDWHEKEVG